MSIDAGEKLSTIHEAGMGKKITASEGGVKSKIGVIVEADVDAVRNIGRKSINGFTTSDISKTVNWAQKFYKEIGVKSPFFRVWFGDWRVNDNTNVSIVIANKKEGNNPRGIFKNADTGWKISSSRVGMDETISHSGKDKLSITAMRHIDEIIVNSILLDTEASEHGRGKKSIYTAFMHKFYCPVLVNGMPCIAKMTVDESYQPGAEDTLKKFYHVKAIRIEPDSSVGIGFNHTPIMEDSSSAIKIADLFAAVKRMDADFQPKPVSGIVNADGTPKVMYHGSPAQFTIFDKKKAKSSGQYGRGFYFTDSQSHAGQYGQQYSVYLNIKNPLEYGKGTVSRAQVRKFLEAVAENEDYSIENYGTYDVDSVLQTIMGKKGSMDAFQLIQDINATAIGDMVEAAELFNKVNGTGFDGIVAATETVAFHPEQIKSATDNIGTFDGSNPDIRYKVPVAQNQHYRKPAYEEWQVESALDDALDHADHGDDNLIMVGKIPNFITDLIGIEGDSYIYRNHVYENMVSKKDAEKAHRATMRGGKEIHFHNLGKERVADAILALENPIMTIADSEEFGNPEIVMILPVRGNNDAPLYAAMSFYSNMPINGQWKRKPHIVLTIAERGMQLEGGYDGHLEVINRAIANGKVLSFDKEKMRDYLSVIADHTRVGNITEKSLSDNIARFRKSVNAFREKNKINYKLPVGEDTSPRTLLAGALEGVAQNEIEERKLREYREKIGHLEEQERRLQELNAEIKKLSFSKGPRDTARIEQLREEAAKTANRIGIYDKRLLKLEAAKPLKHFALWQNVK